jgi:hypothetical protein
VGTSPYTERDIRELGLLFKTGPLRDQVSSAVIEHAERRNKNAHYEPKPGYSDRELNLLVAAARSDAANTRDRIRAGRALLARARSAPATLDPRDAERAAQLLPMAATGQVPWLGAGGTADWLRRRQGIAGQLFLTTADLAPLLVLFVAVTGRNVETIKELPVAHRVLEDRAVELRVVKRRRGQQRWFETVTWEIGRPGRELHTPGGLYLLVHDLAASSRQHSDARFLWAVWRNGHKAHVRGAGEHLGVFDERLDTDLYTSTWVARHQLTADPSAISAHDEHTGPPPAPAALAVDFNRLKTSIEVRRTKQMGGHLPSAARTNTIPVLFRNYLRGDPTVIEWAQDILGEALADAEQAALAAHQRALDAAGGSLQVIAHDTTAEGTGADTNTGHDGTQAAWSTCTDHNNHPATGKPCRESFLDCFHCGNCLITRDHLPRLLGLLDAFAVRRRQLAEDEWWARYGMAWAAIRRDVLSKFSPAEIEQAAAAKPVDCLLDLVETPWEHP